MSKIKLTISSFKKLDLNLTRLTKNKVLALILRPRNFFVTSYIQLRLPLKYLNSYYSFLHTRVGFNKRNYLQRFSHWYNLFVRTSSVTPYAPVSRIKLKHLRRGKIRMLKKNQTNCKDTVYRPLIISTYKFTNPPFTYSQKSLQTTLKVYPKLTPLSTNFLYKSNKVIVRRKRKYLIKLLTLKHTEFNPLVSIKLLASTRKYYSSRLLRWYRKYF